MSKKRKKIVAETLSKKEIRAHINETCETHIRYAKLFKYQMTDEDYMEDLNHLDRVISNYLYYYSKLMSDLFNAIAYLEEKEKEEE